MTESSLRESVTLRSSKAALSSSPAEARGKVGEEGDRPSEGLLERQEGKDLAGQPEDGEMVIFGPIEFWPRFIFTSKPHLFRIVDGDNGHIAQTKGLTLDWEYGEWVNDNDSLVNCLASILLNKSCRELEGPPSYNEIFSHARIGKNEKTR